MPNSSSSAVHASTVNLDAKPSYWVDTLNITKHSIDPALWNKEWERALRKLTPKKIYLQLSARLYRLWESNNANANLALMVYPAGLKEEAAMLQGAIFDPLDDETMQYYTTAWLLLNDEQRKQRLMNGLEEACRRVLLGQDTRAMCPEITITALAKHRGQPFLDLVNSFRSGRQARGGEFYIPPSAWWDMAKVEVRNVRIPMFTVLTILRGSFISTWLLLAGPLIVDFLPGDSGRSRRHYYTSNPFSRDG